MLQSPGPQVQTILGQTTHRRLSQTHNLNIKTWLHNYHWVIRTINSNYIWNMEESKHILIPAKFLSLIFHFIVTTILYFGYQDNIIAAYPALLNYSDSNFVGGKVSFMAANTLTIIGLSVEIIILFVGVNLFKERLSFIIATIHFLGSILYSSYGYGQWQFSSLWALWAIFSLAPLAIELVAACHPSNKWFSPFTVFLVYILYSMGHKQWT